jgi:hypothetical protein
LIDRLSAYPACIATLAKHHLVYAARLRLEWSDELQKLATDAGILVFAVRPSPRPDWRPEWGEGNVFTGFRDDPAEVVLELVADSEHDAAAKIMNALGVGLDNFVVEPRWFAVAE